MAKPDPISSTEKLLEMIRGKSDPSIKASGVSPYSQTTKRWKFSNLKALPFKKRISVGVNIGYSDLKCVKVSQTADRQYEILDYKRIPFPSDISIDGPKFPQFLKSALSAICGSSKNIEIWSAISSARVETRFLRIPKVPKKQIATAVLWSYKKEVTFNEQKEIFDYEVLGDKEIDGLKKTEVMAYSAPREEIQKLENTFLKSGFPLTGITIIPFVIQNLLRSDWIETGDQDLCSLYIGRDWSRIDIFSNQNLILSRGIKAGIKSMIEAIRQNIYKSPAEFSIESTEIEEPETSEGVDETLKNQAEHARQIFFEFVKDSSGPTVSDNERRLQEDEIFKLTLPALERLVRQVDRTLEHYSLNFENQSVSKIYISGPISAQRLMVGHIGNQLGLPIDIIDPFTSESPPSETRAFPESISERESYAPALGMALSNKNLTPNFIYTYKDKDKAARSRRINIAVFASLLLCMVIGIGYYMWQGNRIVQEKAKVAKLQKQADNQSPYVDQQLVQRLIAQTMQKRQKVEDLGKRYAGMAVIKEVTSITPLNVRLSSIIAELGTGPGEKKKNQKRLLIIDGIITGNRLSFESTLAGYLVKLKGSPLFDKPNIKKRSFEVINNEEVLRFTAELELV